MVVIEYFLLQVGTFNDTSTPENTLHSPVSAGSGIKITAATPRFLFSTRVGVGTRARIERDASGLVPKYFLQTEAEAVYPIVKLVPDLVSMVEFKRPYLTQKMIKRLGTEQRRLWFVRALRARQKRRYKCRRTAED